MIGGLSSYPETGVSDLPWLPTIPAHWEVRRNGRLFAPRKEIGFPDLPILEVTIGSGVRRRDFYNGGRKQQMADRSKYQRAARGDIAYNMMRMWQGAVGVAPTDGLVSPAYVVARPYPEANPRYFNYLFRTAAYMREVETYSRGIVPDRNRLYWESFKQIPSPVPPIEEQRLITRFLDTHGALTARVIGRKQRLLKLLEQYKQTIIHCVMTVGLDPKVPLKRSNVRWLGDLPEHWEVKPLKHLAQFKSGAGFPVSEQGRQDLEIPFLKVSDMTHEGNEIWIESWNNTISPEAARALGAYIFPENTIVFPKVGGAMLTNKRRITRRRSCIDNNVMGCVVEQGFPSFVFLILQQLDLGNLCKPGPVPAISEGEVREIRVALPPEPEQEQIVQWVAAKTSDLDRATGIVSHECSLVREFHSRLIADVVTGKLDVRAAAAVLPDELDEPEVIEGEMAEEDSDEAGPTEVEEETEAA